MLLSKQTIEQLGISNSLSTGEKSVKEAVIQFGTGVLLRGLPDYFIDKANKQNIFNGKIVLIKSTDNGGTDEFALQNNLFTHCIKGVLNGKIVEETIVNTSISRVLSAKKDWDAIIQCASNPDMQIVISNTTEVGITLIEDNLFSNQPPISFPGKLLAFLLARYNAFKGSNNAGMVILPTELITDNGSKLKHIVLELAKQNKLDEFER